MMTGRIWIFAETFHDLDDDNYLDVDSVIDYIEHDYPKESSYEEKGWFFSKSDCEDNLSYQSEAMEKNQSTIKCVDRCFCGLYRLKIIKSFKNKNYKKSFKLTYYGFLRMIKDFKR